ncbi:MAG TPA: hypothetical protein VNQ76_10535 [Planctomicrobium sp.]|nr:hypothetical protein [Planctomicrobium sp.]
MAFPSPPLISRLAGSVLLAMAVSGCGTGQEQGTESALIPVKHAAVSESVEVTSIVSMPLTLDEVSLFLHILRQMPDGKSPTFAPAELPELRPGRDLPEQIARLRHTIQTALAPQRLAAHWQTDQQVALALKQLDMDTVSFAELTVRVSCAWSTLLVPSETRSLDAAQRVDREIAGLTLELQSPPESWFEADQKRQSLESLIAFSELINLLAQVPESSRLTVARCGHELRPVMPESGWISQAAAPKSTVKSTVNSTVQHSPMPSAGSF